MNEQNWELALYFDDQSPSYAHGFEAGQFWAEMKNGSLTIQRTVMREAIPMVQRMADYQQYSLDVENLDEHWSSVTLEKIYTDPIKRRLTVVKGGLADQRR